MRYFTAYTLNVPLNALLLRRWVHLVLWLLHQRMKEMKKWIHYEIYHLHVFPCLHQPI
ncbi:unnamed protein product, partial [Onchocerca flexuosa]|uniref:Uncharacterized protein n=1 Tax=Onchocerca flexuosa TaxID=387005 RepID=A0A183H1E0_9BILA